jgi:hypothetical protein
MNPNEMDNDLLSIGVISISVKPNYNEPAQYYLDLDEGPNGGGCKSIEIICEGQKFTFTKEHIHRYLKYLQQGCGK